MIYPCCDKCKKELETFGGLVFSPPHSSHNTVNKYHVCRDCFAKLIEWFNEPIKEEFYEPDGDSEEPIKE